MKKNGIINADISRVLSYMGHTDTLAVGDCGLPIPEETERIDLALKLGVPSFMDVLTVMENILQSDSSIKGVFAHNDEMALGALQAIAATRKDIKVVGFDATDDAVNEVEAGRMTATVAQKPELMGETAVLTAIKLIAGEEVEKSLPVEVELVTK